MFYPIGTVVSLVKNSEENLAVIVAVYPYRTDCYRTIKIESDKMVGKYRAIKGEAPADTDGSNFVSTESIWALGVDQVRSLLNGAGVSPEGLWTPMQEETAKNQKK